MFVVGVHAQLPQTRSAMNCSRSGRRSGSPTTATDSSRLTIVSRTSWRRAAAQATAGCGGQQRLRGARPGNLAGLAQGLVSRRHERLCRGLQERRLRARRSGLARYFTDNDMVTQHPDWFVRDARRQAIRRPRGRPAAMDATNREALDALVRPTYRGLRKAGFCLCEDRPAPPLPLRQPPPQPRLLPAARRHPGGNVPQIPRRRPRRNSARTRSFSRAGACCRNRSAWPMPAASAATAMGR